MTTRIAVGINTRWNVIVIDDNCDYCLELTPDQAVDLAFTLGTIAAQAQAAWATETSGESL